MVGRQPNFRDFVAARSAALMRTAFLLTGDWQRGEDLLQTALLHCFGRWDRIDDHEAYVRRTLVRTYAGWRRRRWTGETPAHPLPDSPQTTDESTASDLRADLLRILGELPPRQRAVVVLRYYEDMAESDVAEVLGISPGTVKSQAARGLSRLRDSPLVSALIEESGR